MKMIDICVEQKKKRREPNVSNIKLIIRPMTSYAYKFAHTTYRSLSHIIAIEIAAGRRSCHSILIPTAGTQLSFVYEI